MKKKRKTKKFITDFQFRILRSFVNSIVKNGGEIYATDLFYKMGISASHESLSGKLKTQNPGHTAAVLGTAWLNRLRVNGWVYKGSDKKWRITESGIHIVLIMENNYAD